MGKAVVGAVGGALEAGSSYDLAQSIEDERAATAG